MRSRWSTFVLVILLFVTAFGTRVPSQTRPNLIKRMGQGVPEWLTMLADGTFVTGGFSGLYFFNGLNGDEIRWVNPDFHPYRQYEVGSISADGKRYFFIDTETVTADHRVRAVLWDLVNGKRILSVASPAIDVSFSQVAVSPNGDRLFTQVDDLPLTVWDGVTGAKLKATTATRFPIVFSPDGKQFIAIGNHSELLIYDKATLNVVKSIPINYLFGYKVSLDVSRDGKRVAVAYDNDALIYDLASGIKIRTIVAYSQVHNVALSPDGTKVALGTDDWTGQVKIYDLATGAKLLTLNMFDYSVRYLKYSPDGKRLATLAPASTRFDERDDNQENSGVAQLWNAATGAEIKTMQHSLLAQVPVAFSPDDGKVLTGSQRRMGTLWDASTGNELKRYENQVHATFAFSFSKGRTKVASGSDDDMDRKARLWDIATGHVLQTFIGHQGEVLAVALSDDAKRLVTGSADNTAKLWDTATGAMLKSITCDREVSSVAFSPDGTRILTGSNRTAKIWDAATGSLFKSFLCSEDVKAVAFSPDGTKIVTGDYAGNAKIWNVAAGTLLKTLTGHTERIDAVAFSPDGKKALTGSYDGTTRIWDATTGVLLKTLASGTGDIFDVDFSSDGTKVITSSGDSMHLWETATGRLLKNISSPETVYAAVLSVDGTKVFSGNMSGTIHQFDSTTGNLAKEIVKPGNESSMSLAFSPDGSKIMSDYMLWDAATGYPLKSFAKLGDLSFASNMYIRSSFSRDGKSLLLSGCDLTIDVLNNSGIEWYRVGRFDLATGNLLTQNLWGVFNFSVSDLVEYWGLNYNSSPKDEYYPTLVSYSPDMKNILLVREKSLVTIWDAATLKQIYDFMPGDDTLYLNVNYSPSGKYYLYSGYDRLYGGVTAHVWNTGSNTGLGHYTAGRDSLPFTSFSPDEKKFALGDTVWTVGNARTPFKKFIGARFLVFAPDNRSILSVGDQVKLWDLASGKELMDCSAHPWLVKQAVFSKDGKRLITADNSFAILWSVPSTNDVKEWRNYP